MIHWTPKYRRVLDLLKKLNLDHLSLDRKLQSLSGGELIRVKLAESLSRNIENALLVFIYPTLGLSINEISSVWDIFKDLSLKDNILLIVDRNPYLEKMADNCITIPS